MVKGLMGGALALAMLAAPVRAACWNADEASAANVRQLQSMLMVAALRCRAAGHEVMGDYNAFVLANKGAIVAQNEKLKAHFIHARGPVEGQRAYDAYTTAMANGYGAAASGAEICAAAAALAREAGLMAGSVEGLLMIADRQGIAATLPEGACVRAPVPVTLAAVAAPSSATPPAPVQLAVAMVPIEEPMAGDESVAATPVGRVDPTVAVAPAAAPVAAPAPPVAVADATPPPYRQAPAPGYPAPQAYYPAPAYVAAYPQAPAYPGYAAAYAPAPRYAAQAAYPQPPRYAPPPGYAYAADPAWGDQR